MLRGEGVICGTSTTGAGTLTLAAVPEPPGGADFYQWLTATGIGFVNGNAILVPYTIVEYTSSTFGTEKSREVGVGTLTLGASLTASTLARTTVQMKATSLDSPPATYSISAPTAFSIATAANTLVFVGPNAANTPAWSPYFGTAGDNLGVAPVSSGGSLTSGTSPGHLVDYYQLFEWRVPMLVKRATIRVNTANSGGTPVSNAYARLYAINSTGQPGKLLYDFGLIGSAGTSLNSTGAVSTGASGSGYLLQPGEYFMGFICQFSGNSVNPALVGFSGNTSYTVTGRMGTTSLQAYIIANASSGTLTPAPDPANVTSYTPGTSNMYLFLLAPS